MFVVLVTALVTWIVSTFIFSHQLHASTTARSWTLRAPYASSSSKFAGISNHKSLSKQSYDKHEVGRQGGHFKKKLHSYINMTNYNGPSTTWQVYPHKFPCVDGGNEKHMLITPAHEGLLFQRPVKTGSTTLTAIILRLVERYLPKQSSGMTRCKYRAMHATSRSLEFGKRKKNQSYLLSVVRDPTHKAISRYFHFDVSIGQKVPTDEHFIQIMRRVYNQNNLVDDLTTRPTVNMNKEQIAQQILGTY